MELKLVGFAAVMAMVMSSNRTFMELKYLQTFQEGDESWF